MKAHDFAFASSCRACHQAIDQGSKLPDHLREFYWLRGHVETMRQLWTRGLLLVGDYADLMRSREQETRTVRDPYASKCHDTAREAFKRDPRSRRKPSKCVASSKQMRRDGTPGAA
jgi:hypothetical protein